MKLAEEIFLIMDEALTINKRLLLIKREVSSRGVRLSDLLNHLNALESLIVKYPKEKNKIRALIREITKKLHRN